MWPSARRTKKWSLEKKRFNFCVLKSVVAPAELKSSTKTYVSYQKVQNLGATFGRGQFFLHPRSSSAELCGASSCGLWPRALSCRGCGLGPQRAILLNNNLHEVACAARPWAAQRGLRLGKGAHMVRDRLYYCKTMLSRKGR